MSWFLIFIVFKKNKFSFLQQSFSEPYRHLFIKQEGLRSPSETTRFWYIGPLDILHLESLLIREGWLLKEEIIIHQR